MTSTVTSGSMSFSVSNGNLSATATLGDFSADSVNSSVTGSNQTSIVTSASTTNNSVNIQSLIGGITLNADTNITLLTQNSITLETTSPTSSIYIKDTTEGTIGHVWTSKDITGGGNWQALPAVTLQDAYDNDVDAGHVTINTNPTDGNIVFAGSEMFVVSATKGVEISPIGSTASALVVNGATNTVGATFNSTGASGTSLSATNFSTLVSTVDIRNASGGPVLLFRDQTNTGLFGLKVPSGLTTYNWTLPSAQGGVGQFLSNDGNGVLSWKRSGYEAVFKNSTYTAINYDKILANTSGGSFTVTLPSTPQPGDTVMVMDAAGSFGSFPLTVDPGGEYMQGVPAATLTLNVNNTWAEFVYNNSARGWEIRV
jgi:hypothetical protein